MDFSFQSFPKFNARSRGLPLPNRSGHAVNLIRIPNSIQVTGCLRQVEVMVSTLEPVAKAHRTFVMRELYERLGIYDLAAQDQDQLNTLIAHWRVHYQTKDGRLGSDLVNYHLAKDDLNTMAQHFLDHNSNGSSYTICQ